MFSQNDHSCIGKHKLFTMTSHPPSTPKKNQHPCMRHLSVNAAARLSICSHQRQICAKIMHCFLLFSNLTSSTFSYFFQETGSQFCFQFSEISDYITPPLWYIILMPTSLTAHRPKCTPVILTTHLTIHTQCPARLLWSHHQDQVHLPRSHQST